MSFTWEEKGPRGSSEQTSTLSQRWSSMIKRLKFRRDYRAHLPPIMSRFIGYRPPNVKAPYDPTPVPPFTWLQRIPLKYETWIFGFVGAFGSILSIEAIMATDTIFRTDYGAPVIVTSFGASAVLLFTAIESPLSQPRNFFLGHCISALVGTCITRLFVLDRRYREDLDNTAFYGNTFLNGGICAAFSVLAQDIFGAVHPPAGATGLNAAVEPGVVKLSWRYLPVVIASALVMLGWALLLNNLGCRRYPVYWWTPESTMVIKETTSDKQTGDKTKLRETCGDESCPTETGLAMTAASFDAYLDGAEGWPKINLNHDSEYVEGDVIEFIIQELGSEDIAAHWV